jgi:hypothetical protein
MMERRTNDERLVAEIVAYAASARKSGHRCSMTHCPHCKRVPTIPPYFRRHALRQRTFLVIDGRYVRSIPCVLVRWRCSVCGRTFTEYPPFAVPHKRYALAQLAPRALRYVEDDSISYRKGVLESYLPVFHWPLDGVTESWGDDTRVLAHSTLYRWVSALGAPPYAIPEGLIERSDVAFVPADWKFTTDERRDILLACWRCCSLLGLLTNRAPL